MVQSIIMNQSDDSLLTQVMTVSHSSLTAAQGNLADIQTPDVYDASHYPMHNTIQCKWTPTFKQLTRFIWPQGGRNGYTSPPRLLFSPPYLSHFEYVSRLRKCVRENKEKCVCVCVTCVGGGVLDPIVCWESKLTLYHTFTTIYFQGKQCGSTY